MIDIQKLKNYKIKKFLILVLLFLLICVVIFLILIKTKIFRKENIEINNDVTISQKLLNDYENNLLSTEEYVKNILYAEYDMALLNDKYKNYKQDCLINVEKIVDENIDEISDSTLLYYLNKINLSDITFEIDNNNEKMKVSDLFVKKVSAKSKNKKVTNLNKVKLSENGNFIIWYTNEGKNAVNEKYVEDMAIRLENTVDEYKKLFGYNFSINSKIFSKGDTYKNQKKILKEYGIDSKYLTSAMQVYLVNYSNSTLARYIGRSGKVIKYFDKLKGGDENGSIEFPYIIIKPSSFSDYERLEQLYNHELFHHYQHEILCGKFNCSVSTNPYILEATANWASALVSKKTNNLGFLNEWAGTARIFTNQMLNKKWLKKYGEEKGGYPLFVYLYNLSITAPNGVNLVKESIYEDKPFDYYLNSLTNNVLLRTSGNLAFHNLAQDYENLNLVQSSEFEGSLPIEKEIKSKSDIQNEKFDNETLGPLNVKYYKIDANSNYLFEIEIDKDDWKVQAYIITEKSGVYELVDNSSLDKNAYTFYTKNYGEYDKIYVAVANLVFSDNNFSIKFNNVTKNPTKTSEKDNYVSFYDCTVQSEEIDSIIETYYFNESGIAYKLKRTIFIKDKNDVDWFYEDIKENLNFTNVKKKNKIIQYEYTDEAYQKYFGNLKNDESSLIDYYNTFCDLDCSGESCKWGNSNQKTLDFNPNSIID